MVTSPGKQTFYILAAVLVYTLLVAVAITAEYLDWKSDHTIQMVCYTILFTVAAMVSFMLLKQVIPQRVRTPAEHKANSANGVVNEAVEQDQLCADL